MSTPPPSTPPTVTSASVPSTDDAPVAALKQTSSEQASSPAAPTSTAPAEPTPGPAASVRVASSDAVVGESAATDKVESVSAPASVPAADPSPAATAAESVPKLAETRDVAAPPSSPAPPAAGSEPTAASVATDSTPASESTAVPPPAILSPTPTPASSSSLTGTAAAAASATGGPSSSLAAPTSATPSRDASPSSTASSARLAAGAKKFSALNVNKKFLETAIATAGKENKDADKTAAAKGAAAAAPAPAPVPHPPSRLLTTRPTPPPSAAPRPTAAPPSQWGATRPAQGPGAAGPGARRLSGGAPWGSGGARDGGADGPSWRSLQANFPTTKESLEDRERAAQKAAANAAEASKAEAEHQKAIIQELDSFRGSHLDPNAHHWDEPESDDDDFLNEVVDFGDGKKYTISASPQEPSFAADILDQREKLMAAENAKHRSASGGRGDYDRSRPAPSSSKPQLFNERSNRLEPKDSAGGLPKGRRLSNDPAPARGPPSSTPAPQPTKPAWGIVRDANGKIVPSLPPSRALPPHLAAAAAMAAAGITPTPSAPAAAAPIPPAAAARSSAVPPRSGGLGSVRPTGGLGEKRSSLSAPRGSLVEPRGALTKPTTSPRPSAAQPVVPPTGPAADRRASHDGPRPAAPAAPVAAAPAATPAAVAAPPPVIEDITELQKDEMHTAAERARLRRQKEEEERAAAQERARQKAKELEAKFGPAPSKSAAVQAKAAPKETARKPAKAGSAAAAGGPAPLTGPRAGVKGANAPPLPKIPVPAVAVPAPSAPRQQQQPSPPAPAPASAPTPAQPTLAAAPPTLAQLIEGQEAGTESQDVDFANLGDLLAAESSPTPAAAQPTASRRPAAADFFDVPPSGSSSGPVLPPPAPSRSETAWRRSSAGEKQPAAAVESVSAPSTSPQATKATASGSPDAEKSKAPQAPAAVEDVMQRIKGAMLPGAPSAVGQAQAEAESPFTYLPRPPSPSPVWKKYAVKLNRDGRQRSPIPANQLTVDPKRETLRAFDALSWTPSMYKWLSLSTLSRDDWLLAPPFRKVLGRIAPKPAPVVSLPTQRISDLPVNPPPESPVFQKAVVKLPAAPALEVIPPTPARGSAAAASQFSRSAQEATWRRAPQVGVNDPSAAVGGPIKPLIDAGSSSNALFAAPLGPETTGAPIIRLRTPPGSKSSSSPKLPQGSSIGFYRDRTPSIGTASDEQMASLVRFTVSSELMDGPGGGDPVYEEDGPSFPSLNRPSSTAGGVGVMSAQDEAFELNARATAAASALSPPSAATSDAWSKTPMAYSPADRPALPGLYGAQSGVPSHSPWAAAPSYDAQYSPKLSHHSPQYQQPQHHHQQQHLGNNGLRGQYNPYAQPQQQQRYASPAHGYALPTSSPHPPAGGGGGAIYSSGSTMNGNAPRFQPSGQQHPSTRPDPSARPFVPGGTGGSGHHPGLHRNASSDMGGSGPYGGAGAGGPGSSPIGGSPYSPGISLPGLPPAVQGGVWVPISMPRDGAYGSSPSLASAALPTPYYTPQPYQQQQQRSAPGLGNQQQQQQQQRFRNLSEFSTSSPVFTPQQQQQQQRGAFGGGGGAGGSPFEVRPQAATQAVAAAAQAASAGQDDKDLPAASASAYFPSVRAPVFTPTGGAGVGNFGKW